MATILEKLKYLYTQQVYTIKISKMKDIFDAKIMCKSCNAEMHPIAIEKSGFHLRAIQCPDCQEKIIHPEDLNNFNHYNNLKSKIYKVKLRVVGNSHTISIPKEIVDFIHESNKISNKMNEIVKLCFEDFGRLSLIFQEGEKRKW